MVERQLPKSLHTITVLENLARHFMVQCGVQVHHPDDAMDMAMRILKLDTMPDPHSLKAAALKKLGGRE
jgi:hypothetical protein